MTLITTENISGSYLNRLNINGCIAEGQPHSFNPRGQKGRIMNAPLIFPELGEQLSNIICLMKPNDNPMFTLKCISGKVHLNIVWTITQQVMSEPNSVMRDLDNTSPLDHVAGNKSTVALVPTKKKKQKSPSTVKCDRHRLTIWLARKCAVSIALALPPRLWVLRIWMLLNQRWLKSL